MQLRPVHSTFHLPTLYSFIRKNPLGVLTTAIPFRKSRTIQSSHIPWVLDLPNYVNETDLKLSPPAGGDQFDASIRAAASEQLGSLRAHLARANPQAKALVAAAQAQALGLKSTDELPEDAPISLPEGGVTLPEEVLILFTGPVQHYITPSFYTTTKPDTGKVVPTWNYEAVEAYGRITVFPSTTSDIADEFLSKSIADLTHQSEITMGYDGQQGRPNEWEVGDAPGKFIGLLKKSIVGVQIDITHLGGKFKMSQEMKIGDREGVVQGFQNLGNEKMAESVVRWGAGK